MDSVTQITLGAAVSVAVMGKRVPVWQSALWGAAAGTTPDLDVVVDFGDAILNMTRHRAESHALLFLTIASPVFAGLAAWLGKRPDLFKRWLLAFWLVFMTHVTVDYLTVYGTQLLQPFTDYPFGRGSIFIIDPLYTLPLLIGLFACLMSKSEKRFRFNTIGLTISSIYLIWGLGAQQYVESVARQSLPTTVSSESDILVTPSPLNSILWRVVATSPTHYYEGWYSLLDEEPVVYWTEHDRGATLIAKHSDHPGIASIQAFSHGFFRMRELDGDVYITDLRMGFEPAYFFNFNMGKPDENGSLDLERPSIQQGNRPNLETGLPWLWQRLTGQTTEPPPQS
ncbi:metal-dependent hydrolase [Orrella daihaiensis]|uniref:Metal-dependent hydrolase n=1 Tax=Orrella daihaiensis TaxID=2782176 RepID=A0ABY4AP93_9BURK|nr:metal-dependent hydrolase [Orrella daihaiensis]UOD50875.1 metal-dependent hydrolase [Orrella daihaiensis]